MSNKVLPPHNALQPASVAICLYSFIHSNRKDPHPSPSPFAPNEGAGEGKKRVPPHNIGCASHSLFTLSWDCLRAGGSGRKLQHQRRAPAPGAQRMGWFFERAIYGVLIIQSAEVCLWGLGASQGDPFCSLLPNPRKMPRRSIEKRAKRCEHSQFLSRHVPAHYAGINN